MTQAYIADFLSDDTNRAEWLRGPSIADMIEEQYNGETDPTRFRWDMSEADTTAHTDECEGEHDDVSGACIAPVIE